MRFFGLGVEGVLCSALHCRGLEKYESSSLLFLSSHRYNSPNLLLWMFLKKSRMRLGFQKPCAHTAETLQMLNPETLITAS